jgi:ATP-dependent helicase YprA (DUF1998 family)
MTATYNRIDITDPVPVTNDVARRVISDAESILGCRLRDWQALAVQSLVAGRDLIVRAGTGFGKTYVYLPMMAAKPKGIILVIQPLKVLMMDQVCRTCFP